MHKSPEKHYNAIVDDGQFNSFDNRNYKFISQAEFYQAGFDDMLSHVKRSARDIEKKRENAGLSHRVDGLFYNALMKLRKLAGMTEQVMGDSEKEQAFMKETENYYLDEFQKEEWKTYDQDFELVREFNDSHHQLAKQIEDEMNQAIVSMTPNNTSMTDAEYRSQPTVRKEVYKALPQAKDNKVVMYGGAALLLYFLFR